MSACCMSRHAQTRANQRGVTNAMIDALLDHADFEASAGGRCTVLRVSKEWLKDKELRRTLGGSADRLAKLALVWSEDAGEVVTVLRHQAGAKGRRYRRGR